VMSLTVTPNLPRMTSVSRTPGFGGSKKSRNPAKVRSRSSAFSPAARALVATPSTRMPLALQATYWSPTVTHTPRTFSSAPLVINCRAPSYSTTTLSRFRVKSYGISSVFA
jgi:hypothetical protein